MSATILTVLNENTLRIEELDLGHQFLESMGCNVALLSFHVFKI